MDVTHSFNRVEEVNNEPCNPHHDYGYDDCKYSAIVANLTEETECIPPFIPSALKEGLRICTDSLLAARARDVYLDIFYGTTNDLCAEPCSSLQVDNRHTILNHCCFINNIRLLLIICYLLL